MDMMHEKGNFEDDISVDGRHRHGHVHARGGKCLLLLRLDFATFCHYTSRSSRICLLLKLSLAMPLMGRECHCCSVGIFSGTKRCK